MGIHRSLLLGFLLCLLTAAPAHAAITASSISSPANGTELFFNGDEGSGSVTIRGTVTGETASTHARIVCYSVGDTRATTVVPDLDVSSGTVNTVASLAPVAGLACRLAIVPLLSTPQSQAAAAYQGPAISVSDLYSHSFSGNLFGYYVLTGTLPWSFALQSAGECPVRASYATDPTTLGSFTLFGFGGGSVGMDCLPKASGEGARSAIQIDGMNAYLPGAIPSLTSQPGFIPITYAATFNAAHDTVTIAETDVPMICDPPATFPPTTTTCPSLHDSGVRLTQTTQLLPGGQVARVTQTFTSADGRAHTLDLLYGQSVSAPASGESPEFEFPGQTSLATHGQPYSFGQFPAGPSSIIALSIASGALPATSNPIGAITYNRPPLSADFVTPPGAQTATLVMHYADSLPANGGVVHDWSFSQASSVSALASLEQVERDRFGNPTVTIRSPSRHAVVTKHQVRVQGSVKDLVGVASLSVNGRGVAVQPSGTFMTTVNLRLGANTIVATATNVAGNSGAAAVAVTYKLAPCKVPRLHGKTLRKAKQLLKQAGCKVGKLKHSHSRTIRRGHVISTKPKAGSTHRRGTKIGLVVSQGR
jgi:hypothetical protein